MRELPLLQSPVPLGVGRPAGGLSFITKALLQGAVFNNNLPTTTHEKLLLILSQLVDICCAVFLVGCMLGFYYLCVKNVLGVLYE